MAISPMYVGQTGPVMQASIKTDDGTAAALTGAIFALTIHNTRTNTDSIGAGTWTVTDTVNGIARYAWAVSDTAVAGAYSLIISYTVAGATYICDPIDWQLIAP